MFLGSVKIEKFKPTSDSRSKINEIKWEVIKMPLSDLFCGLILSIRELLNA